MKETKKYETSLLIFMVIITITGIIAAFIFKSWEPKSKNKNLPLREIKTEKKETNIKTITTEELEEKLKNREDLILLDVQTPENYTRGHLPGAINIPINELDSRKDELSREKEIIVMGGGESIDSCLRCGQAVEMLTTFGFSNIFHYREGVSKWKNSGLPLIIGTSATYKNIDAKELLQKIESNEDIFIVDIRDEEAYKRERIPKANLMPFAGILQKIDKLPKDREIIFYDESGVASKLVVEELVKKKIINVVNLLGGFISWKHERYPTEK